MPKEQLYVVKLRYRDDRDDKEHLLGRPTTRKQAEYLRDQLNRRLGKHEKYWIEPVGD